MTQLTAACSVILPHIYRFSSHRAEHANGRFSSIDLSVPDPLCTATNQLCTPRVRFRSSKSKSKTWIGRVTYQGIKFIFQAKLMPPRQMRPTVAVKLFVEKSMVAGQHDHCVKFVSCSLCSLSASSSFPTPSHRCQIDGTIPTVSELASCSLGVSSH